MTYSSSDKELQGQGDPEALRGAQVKGGVGAGAKAGAGHKLAQLDRAESLEEFARPPGNRLHKLGEDREGQWAISVDEQYRICFRFDGDAYEVQATDYH